MSVTEFSFSMTAGDDKLLRFTATSNGAPVNITGATVLFALFKGLNSAAVLTKSGVITSPEEGVFEVELSSSDTINYSGTYTYEVVITDSENHRAMVGDGSISISRSRIKQ